MSFNVKVVEVEKLEGGEANDGGGEECGGDSSSSSKSENSSSEPSMIGLLGSS